MLERHLQAKCVAHARAVGCFAAKVQSPQQRGLPDYLFAHIAFVRDWFVEFKAAWGKPTEAQLHKHTEMRAAGCDVSVIDNIETFKLELAGRLL